MINEFWKRIHLLKIPKEGCSLILKLHPSFSYIFKTI